jgi:hypothetical protein
MKIQGCDLHARQQTIAMVDTETGDDYRIKDALSQCVRAAFEASGKPDISPLPTGREWVTHIRQDLPPYWTAPAALGNPVGNFPTFRANDGSVIDPKNLPQEDIQRNSPSTSG